METNYDVCSYDRSEKSSGHGPMPVVTASYLHGGHSVFLFFTLPSVSIVTISAYLDIRGQLWGVGSLFSLLYGFWASNSGRQAWWQKPIPELSDAPHVPFACFSTGFAFLNWSCGYFIYIYVGWLVSWLVCACMYVHATYEVRGQLLGVGSPTIMGSWSKFRLAGFYGKPFYLYAILLALKLILKCSNLTDLVGNKYSQNNLTRVQTQEGRTQDPCRSIQKLKL